MLAADRVALRERTLAARDGTPELRPSACVSRQPSQAAQAVMFDVDDTVDVAHDHQQLCLFVARRRVTDNVHHDERCFMPIHVYDTATSQPVAVLLRPGKTPSGIEIHGHARRLVRRLRQHWPSRRLTLRGDGLLGRPEVMA